LARFNIDPEQSYGFKGLPIPAAGIFVAAFPLLYWNSDSVFIINLLTNQWFWYAVIFLLSYLMVSVLPMMAMKFKNYSVADNWPKYLLVAIAIISAIIFHWLAVPIVFVVYVILSLTFKPSQS
jgi:CDP-diacylglycerol--serine O-phosphatidyltransferase